MKDKDKNEDKDKGQGKRSKIQRYSSLSKKGKDDKIQTQIKRYLCTAAFTSKSPALKAARAGSMAGGCPPIKHNVKVGTSNSQNNP
jgi:hypothetical protein